MIYFIQSQNGSIKIGYTDRDPQIRLKELQTGNPEKLELIAVSNGSRYQERKIHKTLKKWRCKGGTEWYEPIELLLEYIKTLAG